MEDPTPVSNILHVTGFQEKTKIKLYDLLGKLIMETETDNTISWDLSQVEMGLYTLKTESKNNKASTKVAISRFGVSFGYVHLAKAFSLTRLKLNV